MNTQNEFKKALKNADDEQTLLLLEKMQGYAAHANFKPEVQRAFVVLFTQSKPRINKRTRARYQKLINDFCVIAYRYEGLRKRARKFAKDNGLAVIG